MTDGLWAALMVYGIIGIIYILLIVWWIYTMVMQLKNGEYVWFVLTILFPPLTLVYYIVRWIKG